MNIKITDNWSEKKQIAAEIIKSRPDVYTENMIGRITEAISKTLQIGDDIDELKEIGADDLFIHCVYDYWTYGITANEELFYRFPLLTHEQKKQYFTCHNHFIYLNRLNKKADQHLLQNKIEAYERLKPYYRRDVIELRDEADFRAFCEFVEKHPTFVVKPSDGTWAIGVHKTTITPEDDRKTFFNKLLEGGRTIHNASRNVSRDAVVLEEEIIQEGVLSQLHPASANGVRCTTLRIGDETRIFYPWLKIGMNGGFATCVMNGSVIAGIDAERGVVNTIGKGEFCQKVAVHPMSKMEIKGLQIPKWDEMIELAKEIASYYPTMRYIGWDLVYSKKGWCVMEGNFYGELLGQLLYDKPMKDEFFDLCGWEREKELKFWWR